MVHAVSERVLSAHGYEVLTAADATAALRICREPDRAINPVVSGVVMPGLSGPELIAEIRALRPDICAVFMSGYPADFLPSDHRPGRTELDVISKPFIPTKLLQGVRRALTLTAP